MENGLCGKCGQTVSGKLTDENGFTYRSNKTTHVECYPNPTNSKKCRFCHEWTGKILDDANVEWRLPDPEHVFCYDEYESRKSKDICVYCNQHIPQSKKKCTKCYKQFNFYANNNFYGRRFTGYLEARQIRMKNVRLETKDSKQK